MPQPIDATGPEVTAAFFAAVAEARAVKKSAKVDTGKYVYWHPTLEAVLKETMRCCSRHGLTFTQIPAGADEAGHWSLTTVFYHAETGQMLTLPPYTRPEVRDEQGHGSALTYGRRYALSSIFNLIAEDDDGKAASDATRAPEKYDGSRTPEELAIRTIMKLQSEENHKLLIEEFMTTFGKKLADLPVSRHADGLTWILDWVSRDDQPEELP